jgi:ankyrin repeat protein
MSWLLSKLKNTVTSAVSSFKDDPSKSKIRSPRKSVTSDDEDNIEIDPKSGILTLVSIEHFNNASESLMRYTRANNVKMVSDILDTLHEYLYEEHRGNSYTLRQFKVYLVNARHRNRGKNVLMVASLYGFIDLVRIYTRLMANVNMQCKNGYTPLALACYSGNHEVVDFLVRSCLANVTIATKSGSTPLIIAAKNGCERSVSVIVDKIITDDTLRGGVSQIINKRNKQKKNALFYASKYGFTEIVRRLLAVPECILDLQDEDGNTPLMIACKHGHFNVVSLLLGKYTIFSEYNVQNILGYTAVMIAAKYGHLDIVEYILCIGYLTGDINPKNELENKLTSTFITYTYHNKEYKCPIDVHVRSASNETLLSIAIKQDQTFIIYKLLGSPWYLKMNVYESDEKEISVMEYTKKHGSSKISEMVKNLMVEQENKAKGIVLLF